ncbi:MULTISPECIES: peptide-binding protein [Virgibacillus]|nr:MULTISPECIES: peptide-binding protein [Virgibacillus]API91573.1 peptide ABC transporter substrate-binding protein [Virgibacillus sp. 6R]MEB5452561.1 peptide-binding protein [Virgibacillus pantothenticus]MEB5456670.1 peptide-binding protein [Virgibacillus pantothenticus]MEB5460815.1 peptide-binding protein [Virgibacillus pantothenticus]MEB5465054.1 peptide-binding protein [Virgibacillus pantothenticus]
MLKKKWLLFFVFMLSVGFVLAACNEDDSSKEEGNKTQAEGGDDGASGEPQKGGTITGAMDTAPAGVFNPIFYEEAYEANILDFTHESLVSQNKELEFEPHLAKEWEINEDQTEITLKLEEGVKWHDGEEFTADDVVFTYKAISTHGYIEAGGIRSSEFAERLLGYEEFSKGETDEFEGVVAEDDYTVTFKFTEPNVTILKDVSFSIIPEHIFGEVPIDEMPEHPATLNPGEVIGTGPFKFTEMLEREQYVLEKHADYWKQEPYLDKIVWRVVDQSVMLGLLESEEIDFIADPSGVPAPDYETVSGLEHVEIIEQPDFGYQLMGFKINHRTDADVEAGKIEPDNWVPNEDMSEQKVRQAMAYAIDRNALVDNLLYGHGSVINAPIAQQFWAYDEEAATKYEFDPEKAKSLLDEAGYKDTNDDGFRETPDGKEWVVNLNYPTGNKLREDSAPILEKFLEDVGINIDLRQPKEMTAYQEELEKDNSDWDLYLLGWSLGSGDPDPVGLWNAGAPYNYSRWNNEESEKLLKEAVKTPEAFEQEYRAKKYSEWQSVFSEDLPALLLYAQNKIYAHNKRLNGVNPMPYSYNNEPENWWVSD